MDYNDDIDKSLQVLNEGGLILYPTDTIWGIGCDATSVEAVSKVYQLKNRPQSQSLIILIADVKDIIHYVANPDPDLPEYIKKTEKPTTIVFEGGIGLAENLINADGSVAIRVVKDRFCKTLIKRFKKPIVSTSANISGQPSPRFYKEINHEIIKVVDYVVKYRQDETTGNVASSIIKWNTDGTVTVLR
jgi:L-threonylcarbamoyladenylate synthase